MYSFYGGRPGNSFIIIKNFPSVNAMKTQFKKGPSYTEVHYDEYVLIDTEDKNSAENGCIYKRGYDYTNEMGGAEYVGRIVGPAGPAPNLALTTDITISSTVDNDALKKTGSYSVESGNLVPGKQGNNFNDEIKWISYSMKDANSTESTAYIGFKIPYMVFDISAHTIDSHQNASVSEQRASDGKTNHPFYKKLKFNIPKGIKGDALKNLKAIKANQDVVYPYPDGDNTPQQEKDAIDAKKQNDIDNGREILVYEYHNYDNTNEVTQLIYLGDYKLIQSIQLSENGTLNIQYTNHDKTTFNNRIKYIKDVSLANDGTLTLIFNTYETVNDDGVTPVTDGDENPINQQIVFQDAFKSISEIRFSNISLEVLPEEDRIRIISEIDEEEQQRTYPFDGTVAIEYNNGTKDLFSNIIKTIDYVQLEDNGNLNIKYVNSQEVQNIGQIVAVNELFYNNNTGEISYTTNTDNSPKTLGTITEIKNLQLNSNGIITATYNNNSSSSINLETPIKWINTMKAQNNGDLLVTYNTAETLNLSKALDAPKEIYLDSNDQKIKIKWKSSQEPQVLTSEAINYIKDVAVDRYGHLLMQFSDPTVQTNYTYRGANWKNLGTITATGFAFNDTETSISNKYLSGILEPEDNNLKLLFDLNTAKILNRIATTTINNCLIKIYNNGNLIDTITIDNNENPAIKSHNYTVSSSVFGFSFVFDNINNSNNITQTTPINIVIENMDLSFTLTEDSSAEEETVDDLVVVAKKVENLDSNMGNITSLNPNFYTISPITVASAFNLLSEKIGLTTISSENTGGTTIAESLQNLKTTTNIIGTTPINTTFYGTSPTITSSLDVLQNKIGTAIISEATTGGNQIISSLQNLKTTIDNFKTSITTNEMTAQILKSKSDIWIDKQAQDTDSGLNVRWADGNFHYLFWRGKSRDYGYFGTGAYSDQHKFSTVLQGYYTYLRSKKGQINIDALWKTKGDTWSIAYYGGGAIVGNKSGIFFTVGMPLIVGGTLQITKISQITVREVNGKLHQLSDITKNISAYYTPANARIFIDKLSGFSGPNTAPCAIGCWVTFKVV